MALSDASPTVLAFIQGIIISHLDYGNNPTNPSALSLFLCLFYHVYWYHCDLSNHRLDTFLSCLNLLFTCLIPCMFTKTGPPLVILNVPWTSKTWARKWLSSSVFELLSLWTFMRKNLNMDHSRNTDLHTQVWWTGRPYNKQVLGSN